MRCPKCGAFMEDGKDVCFMCGVNVKTYVPDNRMNNSGFSPTPNNNANFGSGNDFRNQNVGGFSQPVQQSNFNDYKKASFAPLKNEDKDIFDRYQEHKGTIKVVLICLLFAIIAFAGYKYYEYKTKEVPLEPVFQNLYYEIDDSFQATSSNSQGQKTYSKSGNKGNACSITITMGTSTTGDHVQEYFKMKKAALEPEKDSSGNVVNKLDIYTAQDNKFTLNENEWYYLNIFYKKSLNSDATLLKYKYLTSMYKGYYYDIELINNSNDTLCNASLDNFTKSLRFIET